ncbi:MAG: hypothetical protein WD648_09020 [Planctomycetaceae bacterium]
MFRFLCAFATYTVVAVGSAAELTNGFYVLKEDGTGTPVGRVGGGTLHVGELLSDKFGRAELRSVNNQNSHFQLFCSQAGPVSDFDPRRLAVVVEGFAEQVIGNTPREADRRMDFVAPIPDAGVAERLAKTLKIELQKRTHPGHKIVTTFLPLKKAWKAGDSVTLEMTLTNVGDQPVIFQQGGQYRGGRDNQFRFITWSLHSFKALADVGSRFHAGGLSQLVTIEPGASFQSKIELKQWFEFKEPGDYEVTCLFEMPLYAKAEFRGKPPIWDEFAVGTCSIHIEETATKP